MLSSRQQAGVVALLDDLAALQDDDAVALAYGGESVSDGDDGTATGDLAHVALDQRLGLIVEGTGGLVEDEDPGVGQQGAGDGDALALTAGERAAPSASTVS